MVWWIATSRSFKKNHTHTHTETGEDDRGGKEGVGKVAAAKEISTDSGFLEKEEKRH